MTKEQLIAILLGKEKMKREGSSSRIPSYLSDKYDREGAAGNLASLNNMDTSVKAALVRAALTDNEEDVRKRALEVLSDMDKSLATVILTAGTYDNDATVREAALEYLQYVNMPVAKDVATLMLRDEDEGVVEVAQRIVAS